MKKTLIIMLAIAFMLCGCATIQSPIMEGAGIIVCSRVLDNNPKLIAPTIGNLEALKGIVEQPFDMSYSILKDEIDAALSGEELAALADLIFPQSEMPTLSFLSVSAEYRAAVLKRIDRLLNLARAKSFEVDRP